MAKRRKHNRNRSQKLFQPNWRPVSGGYGASSTYDAFHSKPAPSKSDLVQAYVDTVYSCASLIADKIATTPIKLFVQTRPGEARPKCLTRPVPLPARLRKDHVLATQTVVEEVVEHPALALLHAGNDCHNYHDLVGLTQLYLDLAGNAYWRIKTSDVDNLPVAIYPLPTHLVEPVRDQAGFVVRWKVGSGLEAKEYPRDEIIHFRYVNPLDPYGEGVSPVRAAWQRIQISWKELGYLDSTLSNNARPDVLISPKEPISPMEAERLAKDYTHRFKGPGAGGVVVFDQLLDVKTLNYSPADLAGLQLYQTLKTQICNALHVPPDLFEMGESNRATAEAALYAMAEHCIKPRILRIVGKLNERFLPMFDGGQGRLFFEATDVVPEDKTFELEKVRMLAQTGAITRDEERQYFGYITETWAREALLPAGMLPISAFSAALPQQPQQAEEQKPEPVTAEQAPAAASNDLRATVGGSVAVADLQRSYYRGELPREAAIANAQLIFGFTPDEAATLFPVIAPTNLTIPQSHQDSAGPPASPGEARPPTPPPADAPAADPGEKKKALTVPDIRQRADFDCGAAAVTAVLRYYGIPADEPAIVAALGTTPESGTAPGQIAAYLAGLGLQVVAGEALTLADLATFTAAGLPVVCPIQDHGTPAEEARLQSGHWVIVTGADAQTVDLQDPSAGPVTMAADDFLARWRDTDGESRFVRYGLAVGPPEAGKAVRTKGGGIRFLSPQPLAEALTHFFAHQRDAVLERLKAADYRAKALSDWFDLETWTKEMAATMRPVVQVYYDQEAKDTIARVGGSLDLLKVVQPKLADGVKTATLIFCQETNATTSQQLDAALASLRDELAEGVAAGDVQNQLSQRVQAVFEQAEVTRAYRIAVTEASRAQHAAQVIAAKETGLVSGKRWLLSDNACPLCLPLSGKVVPLDDPFTTVDGGGPYSVVMYPPLHPHCMCSMVAVVSGVND